MLVSDVGCTSEKKGERGTYVAGDQKRNVAGDGVYYDYKVVQVQDYVADQRIGAKFG